MQYLKQLWAHVKDTGVAAFLRDDIYSVDFKVKVILSTMPDLPRVSIHLLRVL
jgi:hypothetical protein